MIKSNPNFIPTDFAPFDNEIRETQIITENHEFTFANDSGVFSFWGNCDLDIENIQAEDAIFVEQIINVLQASLKTMQNKLSPKIVDDSMVLSDPEE